MSKEPVTSKEATASKGGSARAPKEIPKETPKQTPSRWSILLNHGLFSGLAPAVVAVVVSLLYTWWTGSRTEEAARTKEAILLRAAVSLERFDCIAIQKSVSFFGAKHERMSAGPFRRYHHATLQTEANANLYLLSSGLVEIVAGFEANVAQAAIARDLAIEEYSHDASLPGSLAPENLTSYMKTVEFDLGAASKVLTQIKKEFPELPQSTITEPTEPELF